MVDSSLVLSIVVAILVILLGVLYTKQQSQQQRQQPSGGSSKNKKKNRSSKNKAQAAPKPPAEEEEEEEESEEEAPPPKKKKSKKKGGSGGSAAEPEPEKAVPAPAKKQGKSEPAPKPAEPEEQPSKSALRRARKKKAQQADKGEVGRAAKNEVDEGEAAPSSSEDAEDDDWEQVVAPKRGRVRKDKPAVAVEKPQKAEEKVELRLVVQARKIGAIIGPGGSTLADIQDKTGASVELPKRQDADKANKNADVLVRIVGPSAGAAEAKRKIEDIVGEREVTETMEIPIRKIGTLIGHGGENIRNVREKTECHVDIPKREDMNDKAVTTTITIRGPASQISRARAEVLQLLGPEEKEHVLSVDPKKIGAIIGEKGKNINKIREVTGCEIELPKKEETANSAKHVKLIIRGPEEGIPQARKALESLIARGFSSLTDPEKAKGYDEDDELITIECQVPSSKIGFIMGPKGKRVIQIKDATGTQIEFPVAGAAAPKGQKDGGKDMATIVITGGSKGCSQAKSAIDMLVQRGYSKITDPGTSTTQMAIEDHQVALVIGPGGKTIQLFKEKFNVLQINTPDRNLEGRSKKLTIIGGKNECKACKDAIKFFLYNGFHPIINPGYDMLEVPFPWESIRHLIGHKGTTIKSIKGDTTCDIRFPDSRCPPSHEMWQGKQDVVLIVGPKDKLENAARQVQRVLERPEPVNRRFEEAPVDPEDAEEQNEEDSEYYYKREKDGVRMWGDDQDDDEEVKKGRSFKEEAPVESKQQAASFPAPTQRSSGAAWGKPATVAAAPIAATLAAGVEAIAAPAAASIGSQAAKKPSATPVKKLNESTPSLEDDEGSDEDSDEESDEDSDEEEEDGAEAF